MKHDVLVDAPDAEGIECWTGYEAMNNYSLFQPHESKRAVPEAFPEYFDFENMNVLEAQRTCEHEAIWLDENIFRARPKGVDDAINAIKKIQKISVELNETAQELRKKYK